MCRIDGYDERVEVLQSGYRKAKKNHLCGECCRAVSPGESYHYEFGMLEGTREIYKTCAHCMVARDWLSDNCGGWVYGDVIDEVREHGEDYRELRLPLYKIVAGARRKWLGLKGDLMPLPKMPPAITIHH